MQQYHLRFDFFIRTAGNFWRQKQSLQVSILCWANGNRYINYKEWTDDDVSIFLVHCIRSFIFNTLLNIFLKCCYNFSNRQATQFYPLQFIWDGYSKYVHVNQINNNMRGDRMKHSNSPLIKQWITGIWFMKSITVCLVKGNTLSRQSD